MHWLDPDRLPHVTSEVERFLVNPHGEADGILLMNGMEVHFPPHLSPAVLAAINAGDRVTAHGVAPRTAAMMIAAVAIETSDGKRIVDNGPPKHDKHAKRAEAALPSPASKHQKLKVEGFVRRTLHGPRGETRGALLDDGTIVRFPPHEAEALAELLRPASWLAARGDGLVTKIGTVIEAKEIGPSKDALRSLKPKKPKHDDPAKHAKDDGGHEYRTSA